MRTPASSIAAILSGTVLAVPLSAQFTQRVSVSSNGLEADGLSERPSFSFTGRYVGFCSFAADLVLGDTNLLADVFVRDRQDGTTERVSVDSNGTQGNGTSGYSYGVSISGDGRFVAFVSDASNLVPADTNGRMDIFVHDRASGTTERVSIDSAGAESDGPSFFPALSSDGRYVAFASNASNLVPSDTNGTMDIFVRDRLLGTTERVSIGSTGAQGDASSIYPPVISADGRFVAFESYATNLVAGGTHGYGDVFIRDRVNGVTELVSVNSTGAPADGQSGLPAMSPDARFVAFVSVATNLSPGDTNQFYDVFVRDRANGITEQVSVNSSGVEGNSQSTYPAISADGRYVAFSSTATNLVAGATIGFDEIYLRDRGQGTTELISVDLAGGEALDFSGFPAMSSDGRFIAFISDSTNLVPSDTNWSTDVFVRDRNAAGFTTACQPGVGGVIACPCSNPPSTTGRGCDNSAATGGAILTSSGIAYLSMDSLVFTTSGERPTATSIVMQGTALASSGLVFGQGVRCVGGSLERLYTKTAVGGSITAPEFGAGDPMVSSRSAALGDFISAGQSRWYLVYYRDPIVLGGCPATSTFNSTQSGRVDWSL